MLVESYYGLSWTGTGGDGSAADSASGVESVAVAPERDRYALGMRTDGRVLVQTAGGDGVAEARVDDGADALVGLPNRAVHLTFSPDGSLLFGGDALHNVVAWDAVTGERRWSADVGEGLPPGDGVQALAVSADGASIAAATRHVVYVWDAATGAPVATWRHTDETQVTVVAFTLDGAHVAVRKQGRIYETRRRRPEDGDRPYVQRPTRTVKHAPTVFVWQIPRVSG